MQKYLVNFAFLIIVAIAIYAIRVTYIQRFADNQMKRVQVKLEKQHEVVEQRLAKDKADQEQKRLDAPVQVLVKAKTVRACMEDLGTDTINNEVVECTKDHYVTVRRGDIE